MNRFYILYYIAFFSSIINKTNNIKSKNGNGEKYIKFRTCNQWYEIDPWG